MKLILVVLVAAFAAYGSDLRGAWSGTIAIGAGASADKIETPIELDLEQKGEVLSGRIGFESNPEKVEIRNVQVQGDTLTFEASSEAMASAVRFTLKIEGERMAGEMKGIAEGSDIVGSVSLTRMK